MMASCKIIDKEQLSNLSFVLKKPLEVGFQERPKPSIQDQHDVLVAIGRTGICGSDVHYWEHGSIGRFVVSKPMVLGHESAGIVVEAGSASGFQPGDRVAIEPGRWCGRCGDCQSGHYNLCKDMIFAATPPYDGTLTGVWCAPAACLNRLPDGVSLDEGALVEPLAVAVHAIRLAGDGVRPGRSMVVLGAGPVGLLCAAVARAYGASPIVVVDVNAKRLEFAKTMASCATHTYLTRADKAPKEAAEQIAASAGLGQGADTVIEASGAQPSIQTGVLAVRPGGSYVQVGMGGAEARLPMMELCIKEVTMRGSFRYSSGDFALAVALISQGRVNVKQLISERVSFDRAEEAFAKVKRGEGIKLVIAGPNDDVCD
ncbi:hypothetical protein CDD82_4588 [Ophiocordyceps australis]|uniref:L-arabinitol 4-dehydrogenase n=1 Tax=Ophiocordyceps australis TaxID=1399860 RepID=A0A2C5ZLJ6_9HYPO|nr:hypothetical protein CDD82_4588 [Ophiocordyceps australis]